MCVGRGGRWVSVIGRRDSIWEVGVVGEKIAAENGEKSKFDFVGWGTKFDF